MSRRVPKTVVRKQLIPLFSLNDWHGTIFNDVSYELHIRLIYVFYTYVKPLGWKNYKKDVFQTHILFIKKKIPFAYFYDGQNPSKDEIT